MVKQELIARHSSAGAGGQVQNPLGDEPAISVRRNVAGNQ